MFYIHTSNQCIYYSAFKFNYKIKQTVHFNDIKEKLNKPEPNKIEK